MEDGERIVTRNVRSDVRLHPLDQCPLVALNALEHWRAAYLEFALVREDGELEIPALARLGRRKLVNKVVERGAHVLDRVTEGEGQFAGRFLADNCEQVIRRRLVGTRLALGPEAERLGVAFAEGADLLAKEVDVRLGPVELEKDPA